MPRRNEEPATPKAKCLGGVEGGVLGTFHVQAIMLFTDLVADWESEQDSTARFQNTASSLPIRESSDGMLSAWLDRTMSGMDPRTPSVLNDQRNGELLDVTFANEDTLALETTFTAGLTYRYQASLSKDRQALTGVWEGAGGGRLNAPAQFHRAAKTQLPPAEVSGTPRKERKLKWQ